MTRRQSLRAGVAALLLLVGQQVKATTITVKVTVIAPPPCSINGDKPINVDFGDEVMTTRVDGSNYTQPVNYTVTCTGQTSNAMKLQVQGTGATFDTATLKTNQNSLGIQLLSSGNKLPINSWLNFSYPTIPVLTAVLVKQTGATLTAGAFIASATLMVDYQ